VVVHASMPKRLVGVEGVRNGNIDWDKTRDVATRRQNLEKR